MKDEGTGMKSPSTSPDFADLASRTGFSEAALRVLYEALRRGHGRQAQFDHPELGGMGQWMAGGMTMIGDMFNAALAARVAAACAALATEAAAAPPDPGWWPIELGTPDASAAQDTLSYALFRGAGRLAVLQAGSVAVYDVSGARVHGVGVQSRVIVVHTADGARPLSSFPRVADATGAR